MSKTDRFSIMPLNCVYQSDFSLRIENLEQIETDGMITCNHGHFMHYETADGKEANLFSA